MFLPYSLPKDTGPGLHWTEIGVGSKGERCLKHLLGGLSWNSWVNLQRYPRFKTCITEG